jgi:hypothetical protein
MFGLICARWSSGPTETSSPGSSRHSRNVTLHALHDGCSHALGVETPKVLQQGRGFGGTLWASAYVEKAPGTKTFPGSVVSVSYRSAEPLTFDIMRRMTMASCANDIVRLSGFRFRSLFAAFLIALAGWEPEAAQPAVGRKKVYDGERVEEKEF